MLYRYELEPIIDLEVLAEVVNTYHNKLNVIIDKAMDYFLSIVQNDISSIDPNADIFHLDLTEISNMGKQVEDQILQVSANLTESYHVFMDALDKNCEQDVAFQRADLDEKDSLLGKIKGISDHIVSINELGFEPDDLEQIELYSYIFDAVVLFRNIEGDGCNQPMDEELKVRKKALDKKIDLMGESRLSENESIELLKEINEINELNMSVFTPQKGSPLEAMIKLKDSYDKLINEIDLIHYQLLLAQTDYTTLEEVFMPKLVDYKKSIIKSKKS